MTDISKTIIPKSDQLNADDFLVFGGPITITITNVSVEGGDQPVIIHYEGDKGKPYKPGKAMRRVLSMMWGNESKEWIGRKLTLYRDPTIKFGPDVVGGIRISHMSHIRQAISLPIAVTRGSRKPHTVSPLVDKATPQESVQPQKAEPTLEQRQAQAKKKADELIALIAKATSLAEIEKVFTDHDETWRRLSDGYAAEADRVEAARDFAAENFQGGATNGN